PSSPTALATTHISSLSLHDALPILPRPPHHRPPRVTQCVLPQLLAVDHVLGSGSRDPVAAVLDPTVELADHTVFRPQEVDTSQPDRKSTRLNSSHVKISYAVFCLKK